MAANLFHRYICRVDNIQRASERGITLEEIDAVAVQRDGRGLSRKFVPSPQKRNQGEVRHRMRQTHGGISNADDMNQSGVRMWLLMRMAKL